MSDAPLDYLVRAAWRDLIDRIAVGDDRRRRSGSSSPIIFINR